MMLSSIGIADVLLLLLIAQTTQAGPLRRAERLLVDSTPTSPATTYISHGFRKDWNTTSSAITTGSLAAESGSVSYPADTTFPTASVIAQEEQDGATPSPIFVTLDGTTTTTPAATQPEGQSPSTTTAESPSESQRIPTTTSGPVFLPPMFSTISLPPQLTSGLHNGSSLYPGDTASASVGAPESLTQSLSSPSATVPLSTPVEGASTVATQTVPLQSSLSFAFPVPGKTTATGTTVVAEQPVASSPAAPIVSNTTTSAEASYPPASSTIAEAAPTTAPAVQPSPETPSSVPTAPSTTIPLSSGLQVTGTPNNQVPTIRTSIPAATATISPDVAANNLASAKTFNSLFASLTEKSACANGQIACIKGNVGICGSDGAFAMQDCGRGTSCFALPMNTTEGVIVGCYDPNVASGILGAPVPAPAPVPSTSVLQAPPASEVPSEVTTTITPTVIATYTISVSPPSGPETSSAAQAPGFTTTVVVTKTVDLAPTPSSTTAKEEDPSTTSTSRRRTRASTAEEKTTTTDSTVESTTAETTTQTTPSTTPSSISATATGTFTDTLIVNPIPTDEPSEPPTTLAVGAPSSRTVAVRGSSLVSVLTDEPSPTASASSPPSGIGFSQGTPILTVLVTVTQKERETVTVTVTKE